MWVTCCFKYLLSFDLAESWLADNPDVLGLKRDGTSVFKELALFQDYRGMPTFKNELVKFLAKLRGYKVEFDPKSSFLLLALTSANESLMFCLAEPGEAFLLPTPYYPGSDRDLKWRTGVEIVPIHCSSSNDFKITGCALEDAYEQAKKLNLNVEGILVTNPSNPLGTTMDRDELNLLIDFAITKKIHIVSDEIYSGTVFDSTSFVSIIEAVTDRNIDDTHELWNRIHMVYSLSKDLGLPGFRVGMIYSNDETVVATATKMSSFGLVSSQTQFLLTNMISDKKFTSKYIEKNRKKLKSGKEMLVSGVSGAGIE